MNITIDQIKELREATSAGIMECRKALEDAKGDFAKAKEILRLQGIERAEKKAATREVKSGRVFTYLHHTGTVAAMVTIATETDFVAKLDEVKTLGEEIAKQISAMDPSSVEDLLQQPYIRESSKTIDQLVKEVSGKTGEKIVVADFKRLSV